MDRRGGIKVELKRSPRKQASQLNHATPLPVIPYASDSSELMTHQTHSRQALTDQATMIAISLSIAHLL